MRRLAAAARGFPRHVIALGAVCGLALGEADPLLVFVLAGLSLVLLSALGLRAHVVVAACGLLLLGSGLASVRLASIDRDPLASAQPGAQVLRGHLLALPRVGEHGTSLRLREVGSGQAIEVRLRGLLAGDARVGSELIARGRLQSVGAAARTPEARRYAEYLLRSGVRRRLVASSAWLTGARRGGAAGVVDAMRVRAENALAIGLAPEPAALLRGMVLGGDAGLPEATVEDFRRSGLAHILAVSGQNVLLIVILVQAILVGLGLARGWRLLVPAAVVVLYVALCGAQASVVRAGAMGLAGLAALAASRPASRIYALILAAIVVLGFNPRATGDVGAQLSFAAVVGLIALTGPIERRLGRLPAWIAQALAATLAATLATAPLMALHFGEVSLISPVANVIAEPLIAPIVWLGSLTAAIGQLSVPLGALLNAPNSFLLGTLIDLAHTTAAPSWATSGRLPPFSSAERWQPFGGLVVLVLIGAAWRWLPRPLAVPLVIALAVAGVWQLFPHASPPPRPSIVMLDVGQGDATLLLGRGCNVLIDGGPPGDELARKLSGIGVRSLDAALITHPESDHFGGLLEAVEGDDLRIGTLLDGGGSTAVPQYRRLRAILAGSGTQSVPAVAGAGYRCPDIDLRVIGPQPQSPNAPPPQNANTRAAVTEIAVGGVSMFASGDAESPQLLGLPLGSVDVLKVPHHGSNDPGLPALLAILRPSLALIGVGAGNRYGHPTPATLGALQSANVAVRRTDRDGMIVLTQGAPKAAGAAR